MVISFLQGSLFRFTNCKIFSHRQKLQRFKAMLHEAACFIDIWIFDLASFNIPPNFLNSVVNSSFLLTSCIKRRFIVRKSALQGVPVNALVEWYISNI